MPLVSGTTIGGGLVGPDKLVVRRFSLLNRLAVAKRRDFYRRQELKDLPGRSLLSQIGQAWSLLSQGDKDDWTTAGAVVGMSGFNLFTQDKSYRIKHEIVGNATPTLTHQYLIGHLGIAQDTGKVHLRQEGESDISFPANLHLSRKLALSNDPPGTKFIRVRFNYVYDDGGGPQTQSDELNLSFSDPWDTETLPITEQTGPTGDWQLEIETNALKGDFFFDNFFVSTPTGIITKDPSCLKVSKRWGLVKYPAGALIETIYPTGGAL